MDKLLIGAFIGFLFSQLQFWWKLKLEAKRAKRKTYFYLLEIYDVVSMLSRIETFNAFTLTMKEGLTELGASEEELKEFTRNSVKETFIIIIGKALTRIEKNETAFKNAIGILSETDPHGAFKLMRLLDRDALTDYKYFIEVTSKRSELGQENIEAQHTILKENLLQTLLGGRQRAREVILNFVDKINVFTGNTAEMMDLIDQAKLDEVNRAIAFAKKAYPVLFPETGRPQMDSSDRTGNVQ